MILRALIVGLTVAVAAAIAPASAQTSAPAKKRVVVRSVDHTVVRTRDEDGRTRTKIIVQRRSFLNPGTQVFPGERRYNDGINLVRSPAYSVLDNTAASSRSPLPGRFDLPFQSAPDFD